MRRRVTFSRNLTLSLSRTCQCYCKYCAFATHQAHLHEPDEVERRCSTARRAGRSRSFSSSPASGPRSTRRWPSVCARSGTRTSRPTWCGCASARWSAGCCRTPTSACSSRRDLARLREVTASQGLMLESVNPDLVGAPGLADQAPDRRLETIRAAGELRIPFTSGILVGIGESPEERIAALRGAGRGPRRVRPPAGGHPPELRPASPLLREEPADIAAGAADDYWRTGVNAPPELERSRLGDPDRHRRDAPARARGAASAARRRRPDPAQPRRLVAGARRRGRDRPRRAERQRRSHLARAPVPLAPPGSQAPAPRRRRADRAAVRLPAVHRRGVDGPGRARRGQAQLLELHPASRLRPPGAAVRHPLRPRRAARSSAARDGEWLSREELTALFAETRPRRSRTCARPPTSCARSSRATR